MDGGGVRTDESGIRCTVHAHWPYIQNWESDFVRVGGIWLFIGRPLRFYDFETLIKFILLGMR